MVLPHIRSASHTPHNSPRQSNTPREATPSDQSASPTPHASGNDTPLTEAPQSSLPQPRHETQDVDNPTAKTVRLATTQYRTTRPEARPKTKAKAAPKTSTESNRKSERARLRDKETLALARPITPTSECAAPQGSASSRHGNGKSKQTDTTLQSKHNHEHARILPMGFNAVTTSQPTTPDERLLLAALRNNGITHQLPPNSTTMGQLRNTEAFQELGLRGWTLQHNSFFGSTDLMCKSKEWLTQHRLTVLDNPAAGQTCEDMSHTRQDGGTDRPRSTSTAKGSRQNEDNTATTDNTHYSKHTSPAETTQRVPRDDRDQRRPLSDNAQNRGRCKSRNPRPPHKGRATGSHLFASDSEPHSMQATPDFPPGYEPPPRYRDDTIPSRPGSRTTSLPADLKRKRRHPSTHAEGASADNSPRTPAAAAQQRINTPSHHKHAHRAPSPLPPRPPSRNKQSSQNSPRTQTRDPGAPASKSGASQHAPAMYYDRTQQHSGPTTPSHKTNDSASRASTWNTTKDRAGWDSHRHQRK